MHTGAVERENTIARTYFHPFTFSFVFFERTISSVSSLLFLL